MHIQTQGLLDGVFCSDAFLIMHCVHEFPLYTWSVIAASSNTLATIES